MATGWLTAGSLLAWAPTRQSTSTTTRPSPLSPTKLHLSSSRKFLLKSAFSQMGVNPFWLLWRHPPISRCNFCPPLSSLLSLEAEQILTSFCLFCRYNCRQEFQIHDDILKANYKVGRISDSMPEHYLVQVRTTFPFSSTKTPLCHRELWSHLTCLYVCSFHINMSKLQSGVETLSCAILWLEAAIETGLFSPSYQGFDLFFHLFCGSSGRQCFVRVNPQLLFTCAGRSG